MKTVTTAIIHETRRVLSDGSHPVKLRITHNRKQKYYTVNLTDKSKGENLTPKYGLTVNEWQKVISERPRGVFNEYKSIIEAYRTDAIKTIESLTEFSFEAFELAFFKSETKVNLLAALDDIAKGFLKDEKIKTASVYGSARKSLADFAKSNKLLFDKITPAYLQKYEKWMKSKGNGNTTISMYIRCVRAAFNKQEIKDNYPFGRGKYQIPTGRNFKKALPINDISKIFRYDAPPQSTREKMRDYWILSYLCNGANIKDLANLKYKNIDFEFITFQRSKTQGKVSRKIEVALTPEIGKLIDKYGTNPKLPENYILPILSEEMTAKQQQVAIDNTVRLINKHIKIIASNIGLNPNVSTYTARHSFATVLKRSDVSIEYISEALGHQNIRTTENYLADFDIGKKLEVAKNLTNWTNGKS